MKSKAIILFFSVLILSSATAAYAANEHSNQNKEKHSEKYELRAQNENSEENGECNEEVRNHGEYVSCVAHTHPGGDVVSEAARSQIGKIYNDDEDEEEDEDETPTVTPEVSPSVTPEVSPSVTPEVSPSVTPELSPEATPSATPEPEPLGEQINGFIDQIKELLDKISSILP